MSLDGLRAWIGEVERKLGMRTRVFLAIAAIAVGGAGAATYLAVEAQEDSVSKADLQAVRDELAGLIGAEGDEAGLAKLEAELEALSAEVAELKEEGSAPMGADGHPEGTAKEGQEGTTGGTGTESPGSRSKQLLESLMKTKEQAGK